MSDADVGLWRQGTEAPSPHSYDVLLMDEMPCAVLLPTGLIVVGADRLFFAVANRLHGSRADAGAGQRLLDDVGALVT
jgi:hypothetical protein